MDRRAVPAQRCDDRANFSEEQRPTAQVAIQPPADMHGAPGTFPVWTDTMRSYLRQQIAEAANAEERADAVRLAQRLARA